MIFLVLTAPAFAQGFRFGEETNGLKVKISDDTDMTIRIRLQPRLDIGETSTSLKDDAGTSYSSITDMYLRRVRFELGGHLTKNLKFGAEIEADKTGKHDKGADARAYHLYGDYALTDNAGVLFGKKKLPYSRVSLTSSSKQLLIERPNVTEDAKKFFNDEEGHGYYGPQLMLHGNAAEDMFKYYLSLTDGWQAGQETKWTKMDVEESGLVYIGRIEISPPGWIEGKQSDAHLGKGKHITLGLNYGMQSGIKYAADPGEEDRNLLGVDLSFHLKGLALQGEYVAMEIEPDTGSSVKPQGYYLQAGYFIDDMAIEPAIRYEYYDKDSEKTDNDQDTLTAGFNWYLKGHSFKVSANYVVTHFGDGNSSKLANDDNLSSVQLQGQLYF